MRGSLLITDTLLFFYIHSNAFSNNVLFNSCVFMDFLLLCKPCLFGEGRSVLCQS